ncbi:MAG: GntR family transcriptional regulator [Planctomycetota bacterium]|nr:GntR family transcriptional regulator [Planctomycetota bacterium]
MPEFTPTQGRYLACIRTYTEDFGMPPAESEIAAAIGVSPPSVNQMMKTLENKRLIRRQPGVPRSIEILVAPETIPKWKGKRITSTMKVWMRVDPPPARDTSRAGDRKTNVYRFKITLQETTPVIWRRIETMDVPLGKLHELIQTALGWTNSHLHRFRIAGRDFTDPRFMTDDIDDFAEDYSGMRVSDLVASHGSNLRISYEYDFGDSWQHEIVLEEVTESQPGVRYPRCIDGERACPPEDVGGVDGFADFIDAITNPGHDEHEEMLEWSGPYDPSSFDATIATRRMSRALPVW